MVRSASSTPHPSTSRIVQALRGHPLGAFFGMAYLFSWLAVSPLLAARWGWWAVDLPVEPFQILGALAGPTLSAFLVTSALEGRVGVRGLLRRYVQWRVSWVWYAVACLAWFVLLTLTASLVLGRAILTETVSHAPEMLAVFLTALIVGIVLGPVWEEPGWRGFALPRLQSAYGPLIGTALLGVLWAGWHLPGYPGGWLGELSLSSFSALILASVGGSWLITWVYNRSQGSLLLMILMHSASNAALAVGGLVLPAHPTPGQAAIIQNGWIPAIAYMGGGLLVVLLSRGRLGFAAANDA